MTEVWYRISDVRYAPMYNECGDREGIGRLELKIEQFAVLAHTPKGVWIRTYDGGRRFVRLNGHKRFALPSFEEAKKSFLARKTRQAQIHSAALKRAEEAKTLLKHLRLEPSKC